MTERFGFLTSIKTAVITAATTMFTGFGMMVDWMPAKAPALVGMLLSIVLIYVNLRKGRIESARSERERILFEIEVETMKAEDRRREHKFNERWSLYSLANDQTAVGTASQPGAKRPKK